MGWPLRVLFLLLLIGLVLPVLAIEGNKIGYVTFEQVRIQLQNGNARVDVDYTVDPGMNLIIALFGVGDLQKKVEKALNFPALKADEVGLTHAVFTVEGASENYGDRAYWFPAHSFGVTFPQVKVNAPGYTMSFLRHMPYRKGSGTSGIWPEAGP